MKAWLGVAALLLSTPALAQKQVFLDRPGALEALARDNPAHFVKVQRILQEAPRLPVASVEEWIRVQFDARQVSTPFLLMTSFPAQTDISFVLDDTRYHARIRVDAAPRQIPVEPK